MDKVYYFPDRIPLDSPDLPIDLVSRLSEKGIIAPDDFSIKFCGFVGFGEHNLAIFLPRNYSKKSQYFTNSSNSLMQALMKYYSSKSSGYREQDVDNEIIGGSILSIVFLLLEDYIQNGLYVRRHKELSKNSSKVDWRKTVAKTQAYPNDNGFIYVDLIGVRKRYSDESETSRIHATVIKSLLSTFGTLIVNPDLRIDERLHQLEIQIENPELIIPILERELRLTYSERDLFVIRSLINYLRLVSGQSLTEVLIGTRSFHNLWEEMLDACLIGNVHVNKYLPTPVYNMRDIGYQKVPEKKQKTDTVLKHMNDEKYAVVDAKYYRASTLSDAPGWPDLVKQFFYQKSVMGLFDVDSDSVSNHFVFPGGGGQILSAHVADVNGEINSETDCIADYPKISCHYQDPLELMDCYVQGRQLTSLTSKIFSN